MSGDAVMMTHWVIYDSPSDYPGKFVLRAQDIVCGKAEPVPRAECAAFDTLAEARQALPEFNIYEQGGHQYACELFRLERHPTDPAPVVEVWI